MSVTLRPTNRLLMCQLTREEVETRAQEAAAKSREAALLLAEHESLKRQARDKKERSESTAQEAGALLDLVRTKQELRTVEVRGEYHPVTRRVCFTRADTGEVIEDRAATTDEISQWVQQ